MQSQNIWLDTFAWCVKTKFSGRELGLGCITTSYTSRVITVFTQWRKEKYSTALCGDENILRCIWQGHIQNAGKNEATPSRHSHFMLDIRPWWRWLRGKTKNLFKAWRISWTDKCLQAGLLHAEIRLEKERNRTAGTGWDGLKNVHFQAKLEVPTSPTPSKQRQKYFFPHSIHKKRNTL